MFKFSLQTVLEVRERLERVRQKEYSEALLQRQRLQDEVQAHQNAMARAGRHMDRQRESGPNPFSLEMHGRYRQRLQAEIGVLREQVREQEQVVEVRRQALVAARKAHKSLEILRDKEHARFKAEQERQEQATLDEVASVYHVYRH